MAKISKYFIELNKLKKIRIEEDKEKYVHAFTLETFNNDIETTELFRKHVFVGMDEDIFHTFFPTIKKEYINTGSSFINNDLVLKRFNTNKYRETFIIKASVTDNNNKISTHYEIIGFISVERIKFYNDNANISFYIPNNYIEADLAPTIIKFFCNRMFRNGVVDGKSRKCLKKLKIELPKIAKWKKYIDLYKRCGFNISGIKEEEIQEECGVFVDQIELEMLNNDNLFKRKYNSKIKYKLKRIKEILF